MWNPKRAPPYSVQSAQRKLGRLIEMYQAWRRSVTVVDPENAPIGAQMPQPRFKDVEYGCQSQNTEDGILMYIFAIVGFTNRIGVEMCAGIGSENNLIQLVLHHRFKAYMVDGDGTNARQADRFFKDSGWPVDAQVPTFDNTFIERGSINERIAAAGPEFSGQIDFLSLDMDGVDYWILKGLKQVIPRVIVVEYQELWGDKEAKTRPYSDTFSANNKIAHMGASLLAFLKLLSKRNYRLVGCHSAGYNAFFVKQGIAELELPAYPIEGCFVHHRDPQWAREILKRRKEAEQVHWVAV